MSGDTARGGFVFQDHYLLKRLLAEAAGRFDELWLRADHGGADWRDGDLASFGIEAKTRPAGAVSDVRDWDVLIRRPGRLELIEVKSGELTREDMRVFWTRLRREGAGQGGGRPLVPVLVVDPEKAGPMLGKLRGLAATVRDSELPVSPIMEPGRITDVAALVAHAFWGLCGVDAGLPGDPWSAQETKEMLARLEIHEQPAAELNGEAKRLLGLFFENGLAEPESAPLMGWLMKRAVAPDVGQRLFTLRELCAEMGVLGLVTSVDAESLRSWRKVWDGAGVAVAARTARECRLGKSGETVALAENQPEAHAVLSDEGDGRLVVLGPGGAGKSVILRQLAERACAAAGGDVLWCGAADVKDGAEIDVIERACRFRASVLSWRAPGARLAVLVDALDEAEAEMRVLWAKTLARLAGLANVRLIVSVREEVWRREADLQSQLGTWRPVEVKPWPEEVIGRLLANSARYAAMTPRARELLRTPILLDLFWRTFVEEPAEGDADGVNRAPETRHGVIDAFWQKCLIKKPRYQGIMDFHARGLALWERAAGAVDGFAADGELAEVAGIAVSEGILVWTGHSLRRLAFRHPLLRDFALAQWALAAGDAALAAGRWRCIAGGVARRGVLRAMTEALSDAGAKMDWPALDLAGFAPAIAALGAAWAEELAQFLGAREARSEFDPVRWPSAVQANLPASFGASLLTAARLEGNASWAHFLKCWGVEPSWVDEEFPRALASYAESLAERGKRDVSAAESEPPLREAAKAAARSLRRLAEARRFEAEFRARDASLCAEALMIVMVQLPDLATFAWAERELVRETWWVRSRIIENLGYLARVDAARAARLYRNAVGLHRAVGGWRIRREYWGGTLSQHIFLEWALGGKNGRAGLLHDFPEAFVPVVVELIEALWRDDAEAGYGLRIEFAERMSVVGVSTETESGIPCDPDDAILVNDGPVWMYWNSYLRPKLWRATLALVHKLAREGIARDPDRFVCAVATPLRRSRLMTVQSVVLDVMEDHRGVSAVAAKREEAARDWRLYQASDLAYWSGRLLEDCWAGFSAEERGRVAGVIRAGLSATDTRERSHARYLLGRLDAEVWPEDLRVSRPVEGEDDAREKRRLMFQEKQALVGHRGFRWEADVDASSPPAPAPGRWPGDLDRSALDRFFNLTQGWDRSLMSPPQIVDEAAEASRLALLLMANPGVRSAVSTDEDTLWFWAGLTGLLAAARGEGGLAGVAVYTPDAELVGQCVQWALSELERLPDSPAGRLPDGDTRVDEVQDDVWTHALRLANEALSWSPARESLAVNERFERIIGQVFEGENSLLQFACVEHVWPWHWMRWRFGGEIGPWLVWRSANHPTILRWALDRFCRHLPDVEIVAALRHILSRRFELPSGELVESLGGTVGVMAMVWYAEGRSGGADMPDEVMDAPDRFPLLATPADRRRFWRALVSGMADQAMHTVRSRDLSPDFVRWTRAIWESLRSTTPDSDDTSDRSVILSAVAWFGDSELSGVEACLLRPWWNSLRPLLCEVAERGSLDDCSSLFFELRDHGFHHLVTVEDVLGWAERLARRFRPVEGAAAVDLDARPARGGGHTWRECLGYAASAVGALRQADKLTDERVKERARAVLAEMHAPLLRVPEAGTELHRLLGDAG